MGPVHFRPAADAFPGKHFTDPGEEDDGAGAGSQRVQCVQPSDAGNLSGDQGAEGPAEQRAV